MADNNFNKTHHGKSGQENLRDIIESLKAKDYLLSFEQEYRDGYKGFDRHQFYFPYIIEFSDHECWILHSTTSIRSDRLNIPQWNAEHLKRLNGYIKRAYVIYPNGLDEKEIKNAKREQAKISEHKFYSALDGVVSQGEIYALIEQHALSLLGSKGKALAKRGTNFENWISEILSNTENLLKWKNDDLIKTGFMYDVFLLLVDNMGLIKSQVVSISATNNIPKLPTGGKAKTDILVTVDTFDGEFKYTFSCKKTGSDWVSAHEYSADQFIETLEIKDSLLANALVDFQNVGSIEKLQPTSYEVLSRRLSAYNTKLNNWVLGGIGGAGVPETQWAQIIITYNETTSQISVMTIDDYIERMTADGYPGNFGTCFRWTYPSGGLGKRIQLKMKVE